MTTLVVGDGFMRPGGFNSAKGWRFYRWYMRGARRRNAKTCNAIEGPVVLVVDRDAINVADLGPHVTVRFTDELTLKTGLVQYAPKVHDLIASWFPPPPSSSRPTESPCSRTDLLPPDADATASRAGRD